MTTYININGDVRDAASLKTPTDRTFRGAWQFAGDAVEVDMDKARDIWRDKIRQARVGKLEALDAVFMKALETGADTTAIVAEKTALRNAPADPAIDAATTVEELKAVKPAGLTFE